MRQVGHLWLISFCDIVVASKQSECATLSVAHNKRTGRISNCKECTALRFTGIFLRRPLFLLPATVGSSLRS